MYIFLYLLIVFSCPYYWIIIANIHIPEAFGVLPPIQKGWTILPNPFCCKYVDFYTLDNFVQILISYVWNVFEVKYKLKLSPSDLFFYCNIFYNLFYNYPHLSSNTARKLGYIVIKRASRMSEYIQNKRHRATQRVAAAINQLIIC